MTIKLSESVKDIILLATAAVTGVMGTKGIVEGVASLMKAQNICNPAWRVAKAAKESGVITDGKNGDNGKDAVVDEEVVSQAVNKANALEAKLRLEKVAKYVEDAKQEKATAEKALNEAGSLDEAQAAFAVANDAAKTADEELKKKDKAVEDTEKEHKEDEGNEDKKKAYEKAVKAQRKAQTALDVANKEVADAQSKVNDIKAKADALTKASGSLDLAMGYLEMLKIDAKLMGSESK